MFRKPQPLQLVWKVRQYTSNLYGSTPPICIAVLSWLSELRRKGNPAVRLPFVRQYASHLYGSTPPICTAVLLEKYWGLGSPDSLPSLSAKGIADHGSPAGRAGRYRSKGCSRCWGPPKPRLEMAQSYFAPGNLCRNVLEDFCCINFGGFSRGFSWRIFLGTFSHKNEEKKSGEKIREKIRRLKNKNPRKIRSAESRP